MFLNKYLGFSVNSCCNCFHHITFCISKLGFSMQMLLSSQTRSLVCSRGL